jgi:hypothetical protein
MLFVFTDPSSVVGKEGGLLSGMRNRRVVFSAISVPTSESLPRMPGICLHNLLIIGLL